MKNIILQILLLCSICSIAVGCSLRAGSNLSEEVTFVLPEWDFALLSPDENSFFPELDYWEIRFSKSSSSSNGEHSTETFRFSKEESSFTKTIPKNEITFVSARPVTKNNAGKQFLFFYQAGTVYPSVSEWENGNCRNTLTWEDGFTVKVISEIFSTGEATGYSEKEIQDFVSRFNWKKFSDVIIEKEKKSLSENETFYNPYLADFPVLIEKLLSKKFSSTYLNPKQTFSLPLENLNDTLSPLQIETTEILSPYMPENLNRKTKNAFTVSKIHENIFLLKSNYLMLLKTSGEKNISTEVIFLPTIILE